MKGKTLSPQVVAVPRMGQLTKSGRAGSCVLTTGICTKPACRIYIGQLVVLPVSASYLRNASPAPPLCTSACQMVQIAAPCGPCCARGARCTRSRVWGPVSNAMVSFLQGPAAHLFALTMDCSCPQSQSQSVCGPSGEFMVPKGAL